MTSTHDRIPCPIRGCGRTRKAQHVMCLPHWRQVPKAMQKTIWRLYHEERGSDRHILAIEAAKNEVEQQEAINQDGPPAQGTGP